MASYNKPSILDEIYSFKECEVALLTTFNFDISFFDRTILPLLLIKRSRVCVFADAKQFQESINAESTSENIGKRYYVHLFRMDKSFHPKLILLLAKDRAKLIVSSANLTFSSYFSNNEIFQSFSYEKDDTQFAGLIVEAFRFFKSIAGESNQDYLNNIINYCETNFSFLTTAEVTHTGPILLTSYSQSIINQATRMIDDDIKLIKVAVPFYDDELGALNYLKKTYNNAKIELYIQNNHSTFPKDKYSEQLIDTLNIFNSVNNNTYPQKQFYHGKVFCFVSNTKEYVLYGSPNCSISALLRSYKTGGNIETAIFDYGEIGSSTGLFDSFEIEEEVDIDYLQTNIRNAEEQSNDNKITFINGNISGLVNILVRSAIDLSESSVELVNYKEVQVTINRYRDDTYLVSFENVLDKNILDLSFTIDDSTQITVRCFVCNLDYLNQYINSSVNNPFKKLNTDEDMEKYKKDDFLKHFMELTNDIRMGIQEHARSSQNTQTDVNDDTKESEESDDDLFDSIMFESPDYVVTIGSQEIYSKASAYLSYFSNKVSMMLTKEPPVRKKSFKKIKDDTSDEEKKEIVRRRHSFADSLLKYFKNYADIRNTKLKDLDFTFYFKLYELFSDTYICDLYIDKTGIRNLPRLVENKIDYLINRLIPNVDYQILQNEQFIYLKKEIALICIECYYAKDNLPNNAYAFKEELFKLDRLFANSFIDELEELIVEVCSTLEIKNSLYILDFFKNFFINSPKASELEIKINNYFQFESSSFKTEFNQNTSTLIITIDDIVKNVSFKPRLNVTQDLVSNVINYLNRYFGDVLSDNYTFEIIINDYSEFIYCLRFQWSKDKPRQYLQKITYRKTGELDWKVFLL